MQNQNTQLQMRKGVIELCILSVISKADYVYSTDILDALKAEDLLVVEGTLYPLLTRLKNANYLEYEWKESSSGPPRKYYKLSVEGNAYLQELSSQWYALVQSVNTILERPITSDHEKDH